MVLNTLGVRKSEVALSLLVALTAFFFPHGNFWLSQLNWQASEELFEPCDELCDKSLVQRSGLELGLVVVDLVKDPCSLKAIRDL